VTLNRCPGQAVDGAPPRTSALPLRDRRRRASGGMESQDRTCPLRARSTGRPEAVTATAAGDGEGPRRAFPLVRGLQRPTWRVDDSNLCSFRDGFAD
jgi:hypothetical protein